MGALMSLDQPDAHTAQVWARELEGKDPQDIIRFAVAHFPGPLAVATQFGLEGCTLLHRVVRVTRNVRFFTIDTGLLFAETYQLAARLEKYLGIAIERIRPGESVAEQAVSQGPNLWEKNPDLCCELRKVAPMRSALAGMGGWMTGVRREQTASRSDTPVVQWDAQFGLLKVAPLAAETAEQVERYACNNHIPTNPLRAVGYQSVGCMTCTRPVKDGENPRAGRWWRSPKTECGLHR